MPDNDIKYAGFLSYRHVRIIGWFCLVLAQFAVIMKLNIKLDPASASSLEPAVNVFSAFAALPVPLFMLANFTMIMQKKGSYKSLFITYGGAALGLYLLANFVVFHYAFQTMNKIDPAVNWGDTARLFGTMLPLLGKTGYSLNMMIDMLLCVLLFFFANYIPNSKLFQGKRIYLFRAMIALPILIEIGGFIIKYCIGNVYFTIPSYVFFLLPSKPPLVFLAFLAIIVCMKIGERHYLRIEGNTREKYEVFCTTKAHSLKVSILISIVFVVVALIDLAAFVISVYAIYNSVASTVPMVDEYVVETIANKAQVMYDSGLGGAFPLILVAPIAMFFSYTKKHKNPQLDKFVPILGIGLIALVYLEGTFQVITNNMPNFIEKIKNAVMGEGEEEIPTNASFFLTNFCANIKLF